MTSERVLAPKRRHSSLNEQEIPKMRINHGIFLSSSCQCSDGVSPVTLGSPRDRAISRQQQCGDRNSLLPPLAVGGPRTLRGCVFARFTDGISIGYSPLGPRFLAHGMRDIPVGTCLGRRSTMTREAFTRDARCLFRTSCKNEFRSLAAGVIREYEIPENCRGGSPENCHGGRRVRAEPGRSTTAETGSGGPKRRSRSGCSQLSAWERRGSRLSFGAGGVNGRVIACHHELESTQYEACGKTYHSIIASVSCSFMLKKHA